MKIVAVILTSIILIGFLGLSTVGCNMGDSPSEEVYSE